MRLFKGLLITIVAALLQINSFGPIGLTWFRPDILLILSIYFSIYYGLKYGIWIGFFLGLLKDGLSLSPLGLNATLFACLGSFVGFLSDKVYKESPMTRLILVFFSSLFIQMAFYFILHFSFGIQAIEGVLRRIILPTLFATTVFGHLLFILLDKVFLDEGASSAS